MRKQLCISFAFTSFIAFSIATYAQVSTDRNYVIKNEMKVPGITTQAQIDALTVDERMQGVTYFDGLGRPLQSVAVQSNPTEKDIISPVEFDGYGREVKKFLPYVDVNGIAYGSLRSTAFADQSSFYSVSGTTATDIAKDASPFTQTFYEFSPLSRALEQGAPGQTWQPGNGHSVQAVMGLNTVTENVRKWTIGSAAGSLPSTASAYNDGELLKSTTTDEQGHKVIQYQDKESKIILKKVQLSATPGTAHSGWLCTYYIYDDFNNLRFVLQPAIVTAIDGTWTISQAAADGLCFRYEYDQRHRMIIKKVPGAGETWMVYDARDRLIMTQDANLRTLPGKWLVTEYDNTQNRPWRTGLLTDAGSRNTHQTNAYNSTTYPNTSGTNYEKLTQTYYDDYSWVAGTGTTLTNLLDQTNTSSSTYFITTYNTSPYYALPILQSKQTRGLPTGNMVKVLGTTNQYLYTVNFYDDNGRLIQTQGINVTGGKDITTMQYDFSGKALRTLTVHEKAGTNYQLHNVLTKMEYDHAGRLLTVAKKITSTVNGGAVNSVEKTILSNEYNTMGQLKTKTVGLPAKVLSTSIGVESMAYDYNIRGWLTAINKNYLNNTNTTNYFGMELGYDKTSSVTGTTNYITPQYNGNISGMIWKGKGDGVSRKYDFIYDNVNRLTTANFLQNTSGSTWDKNSLDFTVSNLTYDANGNILSMNQMGYKPGGAPAIIDNLTYTYAANGNMLQNVKDNSNDPLTVLGDFRTSTLHPQNATKATATGTGLNAITDYTYDANGNLKRDYNKDIGDAVTDGIQYNHLNLPSVITVKNKGTITYTYDAAGSKLKKITVDNTASGKVITTTTTYTGGFVYESRLTSPAATTDYTDVLQFTGHEEGRIRFKPAVGFTLASYVYDYFIKDHLGNVRVMLTDDVQQDIYPAATLEYISSYPATDDGSPVFVEKDYYNINSNNIVLRTSVTGLTSAMANINENNNGTAPRNNNPNCSDISTIKQTDKSKKLYKLRATSSGGVTGLGITLKVMAGDKVDVFGESYYFQNNTGGAGSNYAIPVLDIITGLLGGPTGGVTAAHGAVTATQLNALSGTTSGINSLLTGETAESSTNTQRPKAYINWILFDEQFKSVASGFSPVGSNSSLKYHYQTDAILQNIPVTKSGYIYVYCSNESNVDVFFDNLQVVHTRGAVLSDEGYYPFGLTMNGITSKAAGKLQNKKGFNGNELQSKEFSDGSGLDFYDFNARTYEQQIGRFIQIDSLSDVGQQKSLSPYHFAENNPVRINDPSGKCGPCVFLLPAIVDALTVAATAVVSYAVAKTASDKLTPVIVKTLDNSDDGGSGSYTNHHEKNRYHGKGLEDRAAKSAKEKEELYDDPLVSTDWAPAPSDEQAFKDEAKRIRGDGGVGLDYGNYNKIDSPGEKKLQKEEATSGVVTKMFITVTLPIVLTVAKILDFFTK